MTQTFDEARTAFETEMQGFIKLVEATPPHRRTEGGICGDWSAREVVAHINGWLIEALRRFPRYARGTGDVQYDIDNFNAVSVRQRKDHTWDQLVDELRESTRQLLEAADNIPPARRESDRRYANWLSIMEKEAINHGAEIRTLHEGQPDE